MFPACGRIAGRQTDAPGADEFAICRASFNVSENFGRTRQVIDQHGMSDGGFRRVERTLFDNRRMQRTPANVLAVRNQPIPSTHGTAMRLLDPEDGDLGWNGEHWRTFYHTAKLRANMGSGGRGD